MKYSLPLRVACALMLMLVFGDAAPRAQDAVDGSWELTAYEGSASVGNASGLLTFAAGRFSLVYTMEEPGGRTSGRAHAGRFEIRGGTLTLQVDWNVQYVSGKGQANRGAAARTVKIGREGDSLTLTFDNGSIQRFRRVRAVK
jgi:hypothetical protein